MEPRILGVWLKYCLCVTTGKGTNPVGSGALLGFTADDPIFRPGNAMATANLPGVPDSDNEGSEEQVPMAEQPGGTMDGVERVLEQAANINEPVVKALVELVRELVSLQKDTKTSNGGCQPELIKQKGVESITVFPGDIGKWDHWRTRVEAFVGDGHCSSLMTWAATKQEEISSEAVKEYGELKGFDAEELSHQLWALLVQKTEDSSPAYAMVKNVGNKNGARAWQKLSHRYGKLHPKARRTLLASLLQPNDGMKAKGYEDLLDKIEKWEIMLKRYTESTPEKLPDDVMVVSFQAILPDKVCDNLITQGEPMESYDKVRQYVVDQVDARRSEKEVSFGMHHIGEAENPEADNCQQCVDHDLYSIHKGGGKGFSKGFGKSGVVCNYCGQEGHKLSQCKLYDEVMAKVRQQQGQAGGKNAYKGEWGGKSSAPWGAGGKASPIGKGVVNYGGKNSYKGNWDQGKGKFGGKAKGGKGWGNSAQVNALDLLGQALGGGSGWGTPGNTYGQYSVGLGFEHPNIFSVLAPVDTDDEDEYTFTNPTTETMPTPMNGQHMNR